MSGWILPVIVLVGAIIGISYLEYQQEETECIDDAEEHNFTFIKYSRPNGCFIIDKEGNPRKLWVR
jgi:hypothetical protein